MKLSICINRSLKRIEICRSNPSETFSASQLTRKLNNVVGHMDKMHNFKIFKWHQNCCRFSPNTRNFFSRQCLASKTYIRWRPPSFVKKVGFMNQQKPDSKLNNRNFVATLRYELLARSKVRSLHFHSYVISASGGNFMHFPLPKTITDKQTAQSRHAWPRGVS